MLREGSLDPSVTIAFIGGGDMTQALVSGLIKQHHPSKNLLVMDPSAEIRWQLKNSFYIKCTADVGEAVTFADVIILSVTPEQVDEYCLKLNDQMHALQRSCLNISLVNGVDMLQLREGLFHSNRIVCAIPNLPSSICIGLTGLYAESQLDSADESLANSIMRSVGETVWLGSESLIPSLIATSANSPSYFYLFMEAMEKAAIAQGLDPDVAKTSILQSALGAVSMAIRSDESLSALRRKVTGNKDSSSSAIESFQSQDIDQIVANAMNSAAKRVNEIYRK